MADGCDIDARPYMRAFIETQAFAMFIQDRTGGQGADEGLGGSGGGASTTGADTEMSAFSSNLLELNRLTRVTRSAYPRSLLR